MSTGRAGFDRRARLRTPAEFKTVATAGRRLSEGLFSLSYRSNGLPQARLGLAIAKKSVPHAVDRNRIKRLIREDFRCHREALPAVDLVFHARPRLAELDNATVRAQLARLRRRLIERCAASSSAASASTSSP